MIKLTANSEEEARVLRLIGTLLNSGIPLVMALKPAAQAFPHFRALLEFVEARIGGGESITEAFEGLDPYFSSCVPIFAKYGCLGGTIETAFLKAARMIDSTEKLIVTGAVPIEKIEEINYYRLLGHILVNNGPFLTAIKVAGEQCLPTDVVRASVMRPVMNGNTLAEGLKSQPEFFSTVGCSFVDMGENSGKVPEVCELFASLLEKQMFLFASLSDQKEVIITARTEELLEWGHLMFVLNFIGMPLSVVLRVVTDAVGPTRKQAFEELADKVKAGQTLGAAMMSMPNQFSPWVAYMLLQVKDDDREGLKKTLQRVIDCITG